MRYQSSAHLPIPNRERNEGGELEFVSHWYPQRPRSAAPSSWRGEWQPQDHWQPCEGTEDDKPSEYSHSRYDRRESFSEPKRPISQAAPRRKICGLNLSTFILSCAVVILFAGVGVVAALLGSKVANLEATVPSVMTQQARANSESAGNNLTQDVGESGIGLDVALETNAISEDEEGSHSVTGGRANITTKRTSVSTAQPGSETISTRSTKTTDDRIPRATATEANTSTSSIQPDGESAAPTTAETAKTDEQPAMTTDTTPIAVQDTRMKKQISGWKYIGCFEDYGDRILMGDFKQQDDMTNSLCAEICDRHQYKYFGTEFYNQCMCGESVVKKVPASDWRCDKECCGNYAGEVFEPCGGEWFISLWERQ